jgi:hypothetical protein
VPRRVRRFPSSSSDTPLVVVVRPRRRGQLHAIAAATLTLLLTLPLTTFVAAKQASGLAITTTGIAVMVCCTASHAKRAYSCPLADAVRR